MPTKGLKTDPWSLPTRPNREDPAKEKRKEGSMREEENQENVVSQRPRETVLRKRECNCIG